MEVIRVVDGVAHGSAGVGLQPLDSAFSSASVGSSGSTAPAASLASSTQFSLSLYDGNGKKVSAFSAADVPAALQTTVANGTTEITVQTSDGGFARIVQHKNGAITVTDASGAPIDPTTVHASALLALAAQATGTGDLPSAAQAVVAAAFGPDVSGTITVATGAGVAQIVTHGAAITASRSSASVPLETAIVDGSVIFRSVRNADGTGSSSVAGFTLSEGSDGSAAVSYDANATSTTGAAASVSAVDALGDQVEIGPSGVTIANAAGTSFTLSSNASATGSSAPTATPTLSTASESATLSVDVTLGGTSAASSASLEDTVGLGSQHQHTAIDAKAVGQTAASIELHLSAVANSVTKSALGASQTTTNESLQQTVSARGALAVGLESDEQNGATEHDHKTANLETSGNALQQLLAIDTSSLTDVITNNKGATVSSAWSGTGSIDVAA